MGDVIEILTTTNNTIEVQAQGPQGPQGLQGLQGVGVPTGGITGYILSKKTTADYDTEWILNSGVDLSNPPAIGDITPNTGAFTALTAVTGNFTTISASGIAYLPHIHGSLAGNLYVHVKNTSGGTLAIGTPVYITGNVGGSDRVEVAAADFDDAAKMPAIGLLETELLQNGEGNAIIVGELTDVNTAAYSLNTELYVGNNGTLTATAPILANQIRQSVGIVSRVQTNTGIIVVNMQGENGTMPNAHASTHHTGGTDAIAPNQISAAWQEVVSSQQIGANVLLSAGRNRRIVINSYASANIDLPASGNQAGDRITFVAGVIISAPTIRIPIPVNNWTASKTLTANGQSYTYVSDGSQYGWSLVPVDTHTHAASDITDSTTAGRALLTAANAQAQRDALDMFVGVANFAALPTPGVTVSAGGSVYVTNDNGKVWVWNGSAYTEISPNTHTRAGTANVNVSDTALQSASLSGAANTAVGSTASYNNTTGSYNTAVGSAALQTSTSADYNTALGAGSLFSTTTGFGNIAIGSNAGFTNTTGTRNTLLGSFTNVDTAGRSFCVALGYGAITGPLDGTLSIGRFGSEEMANLTTSSAPTGATGLYLRIWLNGIEYRIPIQAAT